MQDIQHQRIQERAYMIWLREGCPHGRDVEHWREAEHQVAHESRASESQPRESRPQSSAPSADTQPRPADQAVHGADSQPRPSESSRSDEARHAGPPPSAATPQADGVKKRASRADTLKEDPGAATKGRPSKKSAGDGAVREPPRK